MKNDYMQIPISSKRSKPEQLIFSNEGDKLVLIQQNADFSIHESKEGKCKNYNNVN